MNISIADESIGGYPRQTTPHLDLTTDEAKAFFQALRDGQTPMVVADSRSGFQLEFVVTEDGPTFTVSQLGQDCGSQRFNAGRSYDVKLMAAHLLADLGLQAKPGANQ